MRHDELSQDQVLRRQLKEIRQVFDSDVNGLDWTTSYFILDFGVSFAIPSDCADGLCQEVAPDNATRLDGANAIIGQRIVALLRPKPVFDIPHESLYLKFENGYLVTDIMGAYHGTASTGVYLFAPGEIDAGLLDPVWEEVQLN